MIVKCDQCQSRFKIPDEKVTEKGVKVRCTKCQHTFRVKRVGNEAVNEPAAAAPTAAPPAAATPPPAAPKADPFSPFGEPPRVPDEMATRLMSFPEGIAASKGQTSGGLPPSPYAAALEERTRVAPVPQDFGFGDDDSDNPFEQATRVASIPKEIAALNAAEAAAEADPFSQATRIGKAPTDPALAAEPKAIGAKSSPFAEVAARVDGSKGKSGALAPPVGDPFALEMDTGAAPEVTRKAPAPTAPSPFDFFNGSGLSAEAEADAGEQTATGVGGPPADDFFAQAAGDTAGAGSGLDLDTQSKPDDARAMFDMPSRPPPPKMEPPPPAPIEPSSGSGAVAIGAIKLVKPTAKPDDSGLKEGPKPAGAVRKVSGLIGNLTMAAVLLALLVAVANVYVNEGSVDLANLGAGTVTELLDAPNATLYPRDVSNGLYETREGKPLFYVRGDVENRGQKPARIAVRADILDGPSSIRYVEGFVGATPTPEQLYALTTASDVEALRKTLEGQVLRVEPGTRGGFVLIFYDYPPDLSGYRLKVTATEVGEKSAAR